MDARKIVLLHSFFCLLITSCAVHPKDAARANATTTAKGGNKGISFNDLLHRAEDGDLAAQLQVADMFYLGKGVAQNYAEAAKWLQKGAERGLADSQYKLAVMYSTGEGVPKDLGLALRWYRASAEQGDAGAQYNLARMYYYADGCDHDLVECYKWLNLAAAQDFDDSVERRDSLRRQMSAAQIGEAQRRASRVIIRRTSATESCNLSRFPLNVPDIAFAMPETISTSIQMPQHYLGRIRAEKAQIEEKQQEETKNLGIFGILGRAGTTFKEGQRLAVLKSHETLAEQIFEIGPLGALQFPSAVIGERMNGSDSYWRLPIPISIVPAQSQNTSDLAGRYLESLRLDFTFEGDTGQQARLVFSDVLPKTSFINTSYSANARVTASTAGKFISAVGIDGQAGFSWVWQPKDLQVASGAAGKKAFVSFEARSNSEFYVGSLPVELMAIRPNELRIGYIRISPCVVFHDSSWKTSSGYSHLAVKLESQWIMVLLK